MGGVRKEELVVSTNARSELVDITGRLRRFVGETGVNEGRLTVFVPHTTAGITINEHADPAVAEDMLDHLESLVPWERGWRHVEGNSAAHIKATLCGSSVVVLLSGGALELGTWQGVFLCEFDGPRKRRIRITCESF
jgi:secondary thiamine-phosphate synthase enzyme